MVDLKKWNEYTERHRARLIPVNCGVGLTIILPTPIPYGDQRLFMLPNDIPDECPSCGATWKVLEFGEHRAKLNRCECGYSPSKITMEILE